MAKERPSVEKTNRHFIFFVEEQNENNVFEGNKQTKQILQGNLFNEFKLLSHIYFFFYKHVKILLNKSPAKLFYLLIHSYQFFCS